MRLVLPLVVLALSACQQAARPAAQQRIVSLTPAMTESLFAIGAGDRVVGVTDYDFAPPEARSRTHVGTILQPNYEGIARLQPTLIVGEQIRNSPADRLNAIAPTRILPWLSLDEVVSSTRELGRLAGHEASADALASRLRDRLSASARPNAPRVLLVVADTPGPLSEVWYIKRSSLHGRVLEAAGGRNAVAEDVDGSPSLSLERLIALDPDVVVLLVADDNLSEHVRQQYVDAWHALPIRAVKNGAVRVLAGAEVQSTGPSILKMTDRLAALLHEIETRR